MGLQPLPFSTPEFRTGFCYYVHLLAQPIDCQNPDSCVRKEKCPIKSSGNYLNSAAKIRPTFWQRIRLGSTTKWAVAGVLCVVAVLLMR